MQCPCCKQCIDDRRKRQTLSGVPEFFAVDGSRGSEYNNNGGDEDSDEESSSVDEAGPCCLRKGVSDEGLYYHPRRILVEGWLHKKGTGKDWLGCKSWKPRYARLVVAQLEGYEVDVPLLMIYWSERTSTPSNVLILDSTIALPTDDDDQQRWDAFRFHIRYARASTSTNTSTTSAVNRTFCAPKKARDTWIYAISQALLMYEKAKDQARKDAAVAQQEHTTSEIRQTKNLHPQPLFCRHPNNEGVWSDDRFVSPARWDSSSSMKGSTRLRRMKSPPPTSPSSRISRSQL